MNKGGVTEQSLKPKSLNIGLGEKNVAGRALSLSGCNPCFHTLFAEGVHALCDDGIPEVRFAGRAPKQFLQTLHLTVCLALQYISRRPLPFLRLQFHLFPRSRQILFHGARFRQRGLRLTFALIRQVSHCILFFRDVFNLHLCLIHLCEHFLIFPLQHIGRSFERDTFLLQVDHLIP
jgi:hypothetical protein